jgi:hypothetical protein
MFFSDSKVGLIQPYWSDGVVVEAVKNIMESERAEDIKKVEGRFIKMNEAFPYASISDYETLADVAGVDAKDQHVAKAALHSECKYLVTENIPDFIKGNFNGTFKVVTPDSLLTSLVKRHPEKSLKSTALAWWHKTGAGNFDEYLSYLGRKTSGLGLTNFETGIRTHIKNIGRTVEVAKDDSLVGEVKRY